MIARSKGGRHWWQREWTRWVGGGGALKMEVGDGARVGDIEAGLAVGLDGQGVSRRGSLRGDLQERTMCPTMPHYLHRTGSRQSRMK